MLLQHAACEGIMDGDPIEQTHDAEIRVAIKAGLLSSGSGWNIGTYLTEEGRRFLDADGATSA
jgi:hypothetical protein